MVAIEARPTAVVIPLPPAALRPQPRALEPGDRRGEILLFMGVRYERLVEPEHLPEPVAMAPRARPRRRQS